MTMRRRAQRQALHPEVVAALVSRRLAVHVLALPLTPRAMAARGMGLDELLQEVALGVLARHQGQGRYDPGRCRTAYGYVALVACSVIADLAKPKHIQPSAAKLDSMEYEETQGETYHIDVWDMQSGWQPRPSVTVKSTGGNVIVDDE